MKQFKAFSWVFLGALLLGGCLDNRPKVLGTGKRLDFTSFDTGTQNLFKFNFAFQGETVGTSTTFFMQGASNTKSSMIGTCNTVGTGCVCKFLNSAGVAIAEASGSGNISYDDRGNYYRCIYVGATPSDVKSIKIQNIGESVIGEATAVETGATLSLAKLIGTDLEVTRVRHIFRYYCEYNFLQKHGTTTLNFDCTTPVPATSCDPDGDTNKNFCLLKARFPYFQFADGLQNNFASKFADRLYNGNTTGAICGRQIKQIDCVGTGTSEKRFGLYAQQVGIWDTALQLNAAPDLVPEGFGFAARTSASTNLCPPGLEKRIFFKANGDAGIVTDDILPSHNFTSGLKSTEVESPTATLAPFTITKRSGAGCNASASPQCGFPASTVDTPVKTIAYSSTGQTEFCVIPESMLR